VAATLVAVAAIPAAAGVAEEDHIIFDRPPYQLNKEFR